MEEFALTPARIPTLDEIEAAMLDA